MKGRSLEMDSGQWIKKLPEERFVKSSEIERRSREIADAKGADFYISHATLADIEAGSVPSIYKIFSLAACLKLTYEEMLRVFGVNPEETRTFVPGSDPSRTELVPTSIQTTPVEFKLNFDLPTNIRETDLLQNVGESGLLPEVLRRRLNPKRFAYALIGWEDDSMSDIVPPGSVVEIDKEQNRVENFVWRNLRERPIYFVWHSDGYSCCWCQQEGTELLLLPHPASRRLVLRVKTPRDANVIGRVINAWAPFEPLQLKQSKVQ